MVIPLLKILNIKIINFDIEFSKIIFHNFERKNLSVRKPIVILWI